MLDDHINIYPSTVTDKAEGKSFAFSTVQAPASCMRSFDRRREDTVEWNVIESLSWESPERSSGSITRILEETVPVQHRTIFRSKVTPLCCHGVFFF